MTILRATTDTLEMGNGVILNLIDKYALDINPEEILCRFATDAEKVEVNKLTVSLDYPVCVIGDDRRLLMERISKGTVAVPFVRKLGKPVKWHICINDVIDTKLAWNPPKEGAVKAKAHGRLYHGYYYVCAWFMP